MSLEGKNVIITGSGRGIGKNIAIACAKEGANVGITSRTLEELQQVKAEIEVVADVKVVIKTADITDYNAVEQMFEEYHEELGELYGVIANAGMSGRYDTHKFKANKFAKIIDVNVNGVFHTFKASYPYLKKDNKKDKARFIITGSAAYAAAMPKFAAYTASKYAVVGLQKELALEYRRENINFNMILPTMVDTQLLRGDKAGDGNAPPSVMDPEDLNEYYLFLLSEDANRVSDELIFTNEVKPIKKALKDIPEGLKDDWKQYKQYLEENNKSAYKVIKNYKRLTKYLYRNK
ncbi:MAG: SDR family NAD(P)-dependent oxidoreductase [Promethearchaeia archaeon]